MKVSAGRMIKYIEEDCEYNLCDLISQHLSWDFESDKYNLYGMGEKVVGELKKVDIFDKESDGGIYSIGKYFVCGYEWQLFIEYIRDRIVYYFTGYLHYDVKRSRGLIEDPSFKVDEYDEYLDYGFETIVKEKDMTEEDKVEEDKVEEQVKEKVDYTEFINTVVSDFIGSSQFEEIMKSDSNKKPIDCKKVFFKGVSQKPEFKAMLKEDRAQLNTHFNESVEKNLNNIQISIEKEEEPKEDLKEEPKEEPKEVINVEYQQNIKNILTTPIVDENNNILSYEEFKSNVDKKSLSIDVSTPNKEDDVKEATGIHLSQNSPYTFTS
jgi:hypothetical protein